MESKGVFIKEYYKPRKEMDIKKWMRIAVVDYCVVVFLGMAFIWFSDEFDILLPIGFVIAFPIYLIAINGIFINIFSKLLVYSNGLERHNSYLEKIRGISSFNSVDDIALVEFNIAGGLPKRYNNYVELVRIVLKNGKKRELRGLLMDEAKELSDLISRDLHVEVKWKGYVNQYTLNIIEEEKKKEGKV